MVLSDGELWATRIEFHGSCQKIKKMIAWMLWDCKVLWTKNNVKNIAAKKLLRSIGGWMGMTGDDG